MAINSPSRYDRDRGGTLDAAEFKKAVRLGMKIPPAALADADLVSIRKHVATDICVHVC